MWDNLQAYMYMRVTPGKRSAIRELRGEEFLVEEIMSVLLTLPRNEEDIQRTEDTLQPNPKLMCRVSDHGK